MKTGIKVLIFIGVIALIIVGLFLGTKIWLNYAWFGKLGFLNTYLKILWTKIGLWWGFFIIFWLFAGLNMIVAFRKGNIQSIKIQQAGVPVEMSRKVGAIVASVGIFILALIMAQRASSQWQILLKALNSTQFGLADPAFGRDVSFYTFVLPFYVFLKGWSLGTVILTIIAVGFIYLLSGNARLQQNKVSISDQAKKHILTLVMFIAIILAWNYWLKGYQLLFSKRGLIFGAGHTDLKVVRFSYYIMIAVSLFTALLTFSGVRKRQFKQPLIGFGLLIGSAILFTAIIPWGIVQQISVKPNELVKELPYIKHNINFTRKGFNLDTIERENFPVSESLSLSDFSDQGGIKKHIRLWDHRPLKSTFSQIQEFRLYYDFNGVDVDRYTFGDDYRQVMLSAREINYNEIPQEAKTWVNEKLQFTHGYGMVMSPVNEIGEEGLPNLIIKDIPPKVSVPITFNRPEIYYGELTDTYVIVNTDLAEFDYPAGDTNATTRYEGPGGLPIKNSFRRLLLAIQLRNLEIIFTRYLNSDSRIMIDRNIQVRVPKIAPFLEYDIDPYLVLHDGRLFWIYDAYTHTNQFPYSTPYEPTPPRITQAAQGQQTQGQQQAQQQLNREIQATKYPFTGKNYIRNSVKITIDAYTGDVNYYVINDKDPLIQTYMKIFPHMFKDFSEMPEGLKHHIRYPMSLFNVQAEMYSTYHMTEPQVFYNKEDKWNIPQEIYGEVETQMIPYYTIIKFPDDSGDEEFVLILPFTPVNKNNMLAWIAARCDLENYGRIIEYKFPKEKLIYGPLQIESRIDQNSEISQLFTLWGQKGSSVIRGNLLVIPVRDSLIYVEPVYLRAEQSELPELKRVIVGYQDNIEIGLTLEDALVKLFTGVVPTIDESGEQVVAAPAPLSLRELILGAQNIFDDAQKALREGDFAEYGDSIDELEKALQDLVEQSK
jgi:uncharacterized membrane protein (UPF0182 family)